MGPAAGGTRQGDPGVKRCGVVASAGMIMCRFPLLLGLELLLQDIVVGSCRAGAWGFFIDSNRARGRGRRGDTERFGWLGETQ